MKIYCSNCGLETDPEDSFCSGCGARIKIRIRKSGFKQEKSARDFLAKNSGVLVLACFFGFLFICSSYVLVSGQPFFESGFGPQDNAQKDRNIQVCKQIASEYYGSHTYSDDETYDCDNMAQDVWNMLKAKGINARIAVGDFKPGNSSRIEDSLSVQGTSDSRNSGLINVYDFSCKDTGQLNSSLIDNLTHAWVLAEVSPGNWLAIECTGGYVVRSEEDSKYYYGLTFSSPRNYRSFFEHYTNWKTQANDYEKEIELRNELLDTYETANSSDKAAMKQSIDAEEDRVREKEETFLKTDSELQALLRYG